METWVTIYGCIVEAGDVMVDVAYSTTGGTWSNNPAQVRNCAAGYQALYTAPGGSGTYTYTVDFRWPSGQSCSASGICNVF